MGEAAGVADQPLHLALVVALAGLAEAILKQRVGLQLAVDARSAVPWRGGGISRMALRRRSGTQRGAFAANGAEIAP